MNQLLTERRQRHRRKMSQRPVGFLAGMFTACIVTLIGVFFGVEPFAVLIRATVSSALMYFLVTLGMGIIRTANTE